MLALLALGPMSLTWMTVVTVVVLEQKVWPARPVVDAPVALLVVGFGALVLLSPGSVPGLVS
jgi:predicted metal-binding membrane protein